MLWEKSQNVDLNRLHSETWSSSRVVMFFRRSTHGPQEGDIVQEKAQRLHNTTNYFLTEV